MASRRLKPAGVDLQWLAMAWASTRRLRLPTTASFCESGLQNVWQHQKATLHITAQIHPEFQYVNTRSEMKCQKLVGLMTVHCAQSIRPNEAVRPTSQHHSYCAQMSPYQHYTVQSLSVWGINFSTQNAKWHVFVHSGG